MTQTTEAHMNKINKKRKFFAWCCFTPGQQPIFPAFGKSERMAKEYWSAEAWGALEAQGYTCQRIEIKRINQ